MRIIIVNQIFKWLEKVIRDYNNLGLKKAIL